MIELENFLLEGIDKKQISVIIGMWSTSLNFNYYTKEYFSSELFELSLEDSTNDSKRKFIDKELQGKKESIEELKKIFDKYNINSRVRNLSFIRENFEPTLYDEILIRSLQQNKLEPEDMIMLIRSRLNEASLSSIFYFCITAYLDLVRIYQFLEQELNKSGDASRISSNAPNQKAQQANKIQENKPTATQWALYHYVLQEKGIEPWFTPGEKKKEFLHLGQVYGRNWNNLQGKWNAINNSQAKLGYHENDVAIVKRVISEKHPEALSTLEKIADKLIN